MENPLPKMESVGKIADDIIAELLSRKDGENERMRTGFTEIDDVIISLRKKRLYIVGGRTGDGKTSFMCNVASNLVKKDVSVIFFSLEMAKEEILQRIICENQGTPAELFDLDSLSPELHDQINLFKTKMENKKFLIVDSYGYKFDVLARFIEELQPKPEVIFIDHIQMVSSQGYKSKYEAISEYIRKLKELAVTQNIAIVIASQLGRVANYSGKPLISQLKESGSLEETADVIFLCYWPYADGQTDNRGDYEILIGKNRFGKVRSLNGARVAFLPSIFKFENISKPVTKWEGIFNDK
jgi:replicative DNA helicase